MRDSPPHGRRIEKAPAAWGSGRGLAWVAPGSGQQRVDTRNELTSVAAFDGKRVRLALGCVRPELNLILGCTPGVFVK